MNEHPVPRNVTGFQFQLIGFMTLKQFGYLAAGAIIAVVFWNFTGLSFFRFPLSALFLFIGLAFAFFPIQERPLDVWVVNLIRTIYAPTQFVWQKEAYLPDIFTVKTAASHKIVEPAYRRDTQDKLAAYLASIHPSGHERLNTNESQRTAHIANLFNQKIPLAAPVKRAVSKEPVRHTTPALPPGIIKGLVETHKKALPGILVHITDEKNEQIKLLKTGKEGTFSITIPLPMGEYHLKPEDPAGRFAFHPFSFTVSEEGLHPWLITPTGERS